MFVLMLPGRKNNSARLKSIHLTIEDVVLAAQDNDLFWIKTRAYNPETDRGMAGDYIPLGRHLAWIDGGWIMCEAQ